jgi:hypothetical protein
VSIPLDARAGLPDGFFSDQKHQFEYILEVLGMENVVYILVICNFLRPYLMSNWYFCGHFVYFSPLWFILLRKIWQPCARVELKCLIRLQICAPELGGSGKKC